MSIGSDARRGGGLTTGTMTLWETIIEWFEREYGYNPDPSTVPDGDILRWALRMRQRGGGLTTGTMTEPIW